RILSAHTQGTMDVGLLGLDPRLMADPVGALAGDPLGVVRKFTAAAAAVLPDILRVGTWMLPSVVLGWVVISAAGRTWVLRSGDGAGGQPVGGVSAGAAEGQAGGDQPGAGDCEDHAAGAGDGVFRDAAAI